MRFCRSKINVELVPCMTSSKVDSALNGSCQSKLFMGCCQLIKIIYFFPLRIHPSVGQDLLDSVIPALLLCPRMIDYLKERFLFLFSAALLGRSGQCCLARGQLGPGQTRGWRLHNSWASSLAENTQRSQQWRYQVITRTYLSLQTLSTLCLVLNIY